MQKITIATLSLLVAAPAAAQAPVTSLSDCTSTKEAMDRISAACIARGWVVRDRTDNAATCVYTEGARYAALSAPRHSSAPEGEVRFSAVPQSGRTLIQASDQVVVITAFGQRRTFRGAEGEAVDDILESIGIGKACNS